MRAESASVVDCFLRFLVFPGPLTRLLGVFGRTLTFSCRPLAPVLGPIAFILGLIAFALGTITPPFIAGPATPS